jgi:hypothetical protein
VRALLERLARKGPLRPGDEPNTFKMNVRDDEFIHFTPSSYALEILQTKKLLMDPPHKKFGGDAVYAVSLVYGAATPGTQSSHIPADVGEIVAIRFKTDTKPRIGFIEEVSWERDVRLKSVKLLPMNRAMAMLRKTPHELPNDQSYVLYD